MQGLAFEPDSVTIAVGGTVTWRWPGGPVPHDVVGDGFGTELQTDGEYSHTFTEAGTYPYVCSIHATMTGVVEVVEAAGDAS
jgi:plastocyanin